MNVKICCDTSDTHKKRQKNKKLCCSSLFIICLLGDWDGVIGTLHAVKIKIELNISVTLDLWNRNYYGKYIKSNSERFSSPSKIILFCKRCTGNVYACAVATAGVALILFVNADSVNNTHHHAHYAIHVLAAERRYNSRYTARSVLWRFSVLL